MKEKKQLEKSGGNSYLLELVNCVTSASNIKHYAEIVRKKSILRHLIEAANHIHQLGHNEEDDLDCLLDEAEQKIFSIANLSFKQNFINIKIGSQRGKKMTILGPLKTAVPKHIGIILDGNRRFAKRLMMKPWGGQRR